MLVTARALFESNQAFAPSRVGKLNMRQDRINAPDMHGIFLGSTTLYREIAIYTSASSLVLTLLHIAPRQRIRKRIPPRLKRRRRALGGWLIDGQLFPGALHDRPSDVLESLSRPVQRRLGFGATGFQAREVRLGLAADGAELGVNLAGSGDGAWTGG